MLIKHASSEPVSTEYIEYTLSGLRPFKQCTYHVNVLWEICMYLIILNKKQNQIEMFASFMEFGFGKKEEN